MKESTGYPSYVLLDKPWWHSRRLITLNAYIGLLLLANFADGYDGSMMNGLQALSQWNASFSNPAGPRLALLAIIQRVGGLFALPFMPYAADRLGRKRTVLIGASIMLIGAVLQAASQNVGMFIGARFLIGCGSAFATNAAPMLITELAQGGAVLAAWTTFGSFRIQSSWAWRLPSLIQGVPALLQLLFVGFVPESPRWLVAKGRENEALDTLAYYHAEGDRTSPIIAYQHAQITNSLAIESQSSWSALVATRGMRKRVMVVVALAFFSQWSGNGLVAYYLAPVFKTIGITNPFTQLLVNALLSTLNVVMAVLAASFCDRIGRRTLFITSTAGLLIFFTLETIFSALYAKNGEKAMATAVVVFIFLYFAAFDLAYSPLVGAYTVEIMPTPLRAKGLTVYYFSISASFVFNQYANPIALQRIGWKYYIVFCVWLVFELVFVVLFVVETKGKTLEETAAVFDGNEKVEAVRVNAEVEGEATAVEKYHTEEEGG